MPLQINPAEFVLELMNIDFALHRERAQQRLEQIQLAWAASPRAESVAAEIDAAFAEKDVVKSEKQSRANFLVVTLVLTHRSFIKSYRDVVAYGIRIAMYTGLAIMMGTVWLRLGSSQTDIQPFINAIFFGSAFMSFMAVAYVPAFLEDRATFIKERANGLYGATAFMASNFLIGIPYLFLIALLFSAVAYWLTAFQPTATAFFVWILWLFLDLLAAESLVVLMSSLFPNFVVALALTAFANGLWMSVGGFLVPPTVLNVFWKYVFHYIDYQTYVFQGMMVNEFRDRVYDCARVEGAGASSCNCMYVTDLAAQCQISGAGVLASYGYATDQTGQWVGILIGIVTGYRLLGWLAMVLRK
jgi:ABC-type multidrug transport system permease subunit